MALYAFRLGTRISAAATDCRTFCPAYSTSFHTLFKSRPITLAVRLTASSRDRGLSMADITFLKWLVAMVVSIDTQPIFLGCSYQDQGPSSASEVGAEYCGSPQDHAHDRHSPIRYATPIQKRQSGVCWSSRHLHQNFPVAGEQNFSSLGFWRSPN